MTARGGAASRAMALWFGLACSSAVLSADPVEQINLPPAQAPEYLPSDQPQPFVLPPVEPGAGEEDGAALIEVRRIVFRGNKVVPTAELDAVAKPYLDRRVITIADLEELRQKLTRHYVDRGYVNSGAVASDVTTETGTVTFEILEGRLEAVRIVGLEGLNEKYVTSRLQREPDAILDIEQLRERFQLLLDDPLFARINARLLPTPELGRAVLDVAVERERPYQLTAFVNNYRPPSVGSEALGLRGWVRNLTGRGDVLEASVQDSPEDGSPYSGEVGWRVPLNYAGTDFGLRFYHDGSAVIDEALQDLDIESVTQSWEATLSQLLIERLRHRLGVGLTWLERRNETTLLDQPFSFETGITSGITKAHAWRLYSEYAYRSEQQVLALRATYSMIRNNVEQLPDVPPELLPDQDYDIWLLQGIYARRVGERGAQIVLRTTAQWTDNRLLAIDGMAIGGVYTVRGYRENTLVRDRGVVVTAELEYPLRLRNTAARVALVPFCDYGAGEDTGMSADELSSCGLALRAAWRGLSVDLAVGVRIGYPDFVDVDKDDLQDYGIHFEVRYDFFQPRRR
jgi:hemolysin activation/secretion protein